MSSVSTGLNILSILWTTLEDQLEYQMSFETLLKSTLLVKFTVLTDYFEQNGVKIVSIATCKSLLAPLVNHL
jgi:hypothetical protein